MKIVKGLTLASFFVAKEKCTTLKCVKYNVRKSQVATKQEKKSKNLVLILITDDVGCIEVGELFVRKREHWSKNLLTNTQSQVSTVHKNIDI